MIVIEKKRNTGKTTILLHYMECDPYSFYVTRIEEYAERAFRLAQNLGLDIERSRFVGMTGVDPAWKQHAFKILIDDADCILARYPKLGYELIAIADIITITEGAQ